MFDNVFIYKQASVEKNKGLIQDLHKTEEDLRKQHFTLEKEKADLLVKLKDSDEIIQTLTEKIDSKKEKVKMYTFHSILY